MRGRTKHRAELAKLVLKPPSLSPRRRRRWLLCRQRPASAAVSREVDRARSHLSLSGWPNQPGATVNGAAAATPVRDRRLLPGRPPVRNQQQRRRERPRRRREERQLQAPMSGARRTGRWICEQTASKVEWVWDRVWASWSRVRSSDPSYRTPSWHPSVRSYVAVSRPRPRPGRGPDTRTSHAAAGGTPRGVRVCTFDTPPDSRRDGPPAGPLTASPI